MTAVRSAQESGSSLSVTMLLPVMTNTQSGSFRAVTSLAQGLKALGVETRLRALYASNDALRSAKTICPTNSYRIAAEEPRGAMVSEYLFHSATGLMKRWVNESDPASWTSDILVVFGDFPTGFLSWAKRRSLSSRIVLYSWGLPALYAHFNGAQVALQSGPAAITLLRTLSPILDRRYFELRNADAIIPITDWLGHFLSLSLSTTCAQAIPMPVDTEFFKPVVERDEIGHPYALVVGSRGDVDFEAIERLAPHFPIVKAGSGAIKNCLNLGYVQPHERLRSLYTHASFVINVPTLGPVGMVPLEALSCGTPVISLAYPGGKEQLPHELQGLLAYSHRELQETVTRVWTSGFDTKTRARMREYICNTYSPEVLAKRFVRFFRWLMRD